MVQYLTRRESIPTRLAVVFLLLAALIWFSPSEETLGELIKVVYLHGALVRVAEFTFLASGLLGLFYLVRQSDLALSWSWALQKASFLFWLVSFLTSLYIMRMAWGGINWVEPRFLATGRVLSVALIALALGYLVDKPKIIALTGILMGIIVTVEIATAGLMLHPANPIGTSPSLSTKAYYYSIMVVIFVLAVETAHWLVPAKAKQDVKAM